MSTYITITLSGDLSQEEEKEFSTVVRNALIEYREHRIQHCTDRYSVHRVEVANKLIGAMEREDYIINHALSLPKEG